ncbi:hypothetical protein [Pseudomonas guariconensis]|uniref:hypothetical protein n=1 Tax=Pseudomonas guariconensis TaxID=1288410 RepID=UPI002F3FF471
MSVRRHDIEGQAKRLRLFVSEAVRAATGEPLLMTQTLDQMVRAAAKAGVSLHFSTESQADAVQKIHGEVLQLKAENEALRKQVVDDERKLDALLAHCDDGECAICAQIICPHGGAMHFHHDGCPSCAAHEEAMAKERGQ